MANQGSWQPGQSFLPFSPGAPKSFEPVSYVERRRLEGLSACLPSSWVNTAVWIYIYLNHMLPHSQGTIRFVPKAQWVPDSKAKICFLCPKVRRA